MKRSPEPGDEVRTRKRQKAPVAEEVAPDSQSLRKGKACSVCRKLKVKCDAGENGQASCSRCIRLGLKYLSEKRTWTSADAENRPDGSEMQLAILRLERAMEDVLVRLHMPALDLYTKTVIVEQSDGRDPTRASSHEPAGENGDEKAVSPGPMNSLIEATRLQGLTSQLRSVKLRRKGGMRRMEHDLISEHVITREDAEDMLHLFKTLLSPYLFSASIPEDATLETIRVSSTVLFTAIMLVSALHMPGKEDIHEACHSRFLGLVSTAIFDRFHTLDDIRGLCVAAFWQPDLSWKLSGIAIRMATELNLHHAFHEAFYTEYLSEDVRADCLEKARIWYLLFVLDHQSSIAYGRPPVMAELRPIKDSEVLLQSAWCKPSDQALVAQVTGCAILSKAFEVFGLEPKRTMGGDDGSVLSHLKFTDDARAWSEKWLQSGETRSADHLGRAVELHNYFSELVLNSLVLRGRSLENLTSLPPSLRPLALRATEAAHNILQHFINDPHYQRGIIGMPLYLLSMIAFAIVFLMKLSHRWHAIGITIDPSQRTKPLIESVIKLLRGCNAGANHMVYSMANGFERMLKQSESKAAKNGRSRPEPRVRQQSVSNIVGHSAEQNGLHPRASWEFSGANNVRAGPATTISGVPEQGQTDSNQDFSPLAYNYPVSHASDISYGNWGFQDEELWSIGMGYDLLAPGGQGMTNADFPLPMYNNDQNVWPS